MATLGTKADKNSNWYRKPYTFILNPTSNTLDIYLKEGEDIDSEPLLTIDGAEYGVKFNMVENYRIDEMIHGMLDRAGVLNKLQKCN